jgi:two-component system phosphate regulon sensor histidine kinase PhoR
MELLLIILLIIIGLLSFLLLKKERVFGISIDNNKNKDQVKIIESKDYRKNIYDLLNYIPEGILILDKSKKIIYTNNSASEFYKFQQLKSDFVANVSHELRTPLQSIKMGLETFENNPDLKKNSEVTNLLPIMTSQSERMENLIRDLLSLSKIELQEHIRPTHEIDLTELIEYVIKTYEKLVSKNNIKLNFYKVDNFKIIGDRDKLIEIFTNLIDNAIKYSDKNKEVSITFKKEGDLNIVSVADQGIGIPKESIHRITERFFTVDPSKSRSVGGTGLGLAIVKHLVSQHRAEMLISSIENQGTTVDIKFNAL